MEYRFKEIREDNDLRQVDIAEKINVSRANYSVWESETVNIPLLKFNDYCNAFKLSMDYVSKNANTNKEQHIDYSKKITKQEVGKRLSVLQEEVGMKQKEISKIIGVDESTYSKYKNGTNMIQTLMLKELSSKFGYSMDWIVGRSENKFIK